MKKTDKILITGGSGFCGINLIRYFYGKGYRNLRALDIADFDYVDMKGKIDFIKGDIRIDKDMDCAYKGVKYVIHCAAALPLYKEKDIYSTEVDGTRNVLKFAKKYKVRRVINISTGAVYGIPDHAPLLEDDPTKPIGPYAIAKVMAEGICNEYRSKGLVVPTIRTTPIEGPERMGIMSIYYDWIYRGKNIPIIGNGKNKFQLLDVEDFADAIMLCLTLDPKKINTTFNLGTDRYTTMKEDFGAVLGHRGAKKRIICVPAKPLNILLSVLSFLRISPLYKWLYESAYRDNVFSTEKAKKLLDFKPKYSNKQTLIRGYESYVRDINKYKHEQKGITHRVPWKQGILKMISWFF